MSVSVQYFRPRKVGPELRIEDAVVRSIQDVFSFEDLPYWVGGSLQLGTGFPDIVTASYKPKLAAYQSDNNCDHFILAYLRSVRWARERTIANRLGYSPSNLRPRIEYLMDAGIITRYFNDVYSIAHEWRHILPEVIAVEAKVTNWQAALNQAARNRIFAHRSYVALPEQIAVRVSNLTIFESYGVGILSVGADNTVTVTRNARRSIPVVWNYYFQLANCAARSLRHMV